MAWRSFSVISCDMAVLQSWGNRMMIEIAPKPMIPNGFASRRREEWVERRCKVWMEAVKHKKGEGVGEDRRRPMIPDRMRPEKPHVPGHHLAAPPSNATTECSPACDRTLSGHAKAEQPSSIYGVGARKETAARQDAGKARRDEGRNRQSARRGKGGCGQTGDGPRKEMRAGVTGSRDI